MTRYHFEKLIASGAFGRVYLAKDKETKVDYAVKQIMLNNIRDRKAFENEINILSMLDHPNVIKLYEIWLLHDKVYLVIEHCKGGELFDYILTNRNLSEHAAAKIMQ